MHKLGGGFNEGHSTTAMAVKWVIFFFLLSFKSVPSVAGATVDDVLAGMEKAGISLKSFSASFTQERVFVIADDREQREGIFYFKSSGRMVWEFNKPAVRRVLIEPGLISIYDPAIKQLMRQKLDVTKSEFCVIGFGAKQKSMKEKYNIELLGIDASAGGSQSYHLKLIPRAAGESLFTMFELWVDDKDFLPRKIKFYEETRDETTLIFSGVKINASMPSSVFEMKVPADTKVIQ